MIAELLDRRLRAVRERQALPDLPEVRAYLRACWLDGFTFGLVPVPSGTRDAAMNAMAKDWPNVSAGQRGRT